MNHLKSTTTSSCPTWPDNQPEVTNTWATKFLGITNIRLPNPSGLTTPQKPPLNFHNLLPYLNIHLYKRQKEDRNNFTELKRIPNPLGDTYLFLKEWSFLLIRQTKGSHVEDKHGFALFRSFRYLNKKDSWW